MKQRCGHSCQMVSGVEYLRLALLHSEYKVKQGRIVVPTSASGFLDMLVEIGVMNRFNEGDFGTIFIAGGYPC